MSGPDRLPFEISVRIWNATHRLGTKFYNIIAIEGTSKKGPALLINRWGKVRADGQANIMREDASVINKLFDRKKDEKLDRGYSDNIVERTLVCATRNDLKRTIGVLAMDLIDDYAHLEYLFKSVMQEHYSDNQDDVIIEEPPAPPKEIDNKVDNKNWGLF